MLRGPCDSREIPCLPFPFSPPRCIFPINTESQDPVEACALRIHFNPHDLCRSNTIVYRRCRWSGQFFISQFQNIDLNESGHNQKEIGIFSSVHHKISGNINIRRCPFSIIIHIVVFKSHGMWQRLLFKSYRLCTRKINTDFDNRRTIPWTTGCVYSVGRVSRTRAYVRNCCVALLEFCDQL